ncbi:hypothetical protein SteCoe_7597 [Stentor coeruleus]|uniref:non-specific serine/threonine protein kinase n=1 Tax=Stentor coeruleus TaxID=5963 RepID=A0A1R2CM73_9CILI|nr:hypothetical protein SteCoe_7597 [Stentor coeruleus]
MGCSISRTQQTVHRNGYKKSSSRSLSVTPGTFFRLSTSFNYLDYVEIKKLGSGAFAEVMLCLHKPTKTYRAVKILHKSGLSHHQIDSNNMLKETQILKDLDHPNILKCFEIFEDDKRYYVAMEYCPAGDLFTEIVKMKKFNETQVAEIMFQMISALVYCHNRRIIHRDIKPENILLMEASENLCIKVADFGSSCILDPEFRLSGCYGSAYYLAPEVLKATYDEKCDIWSLGIIMYILLTGKPPYRGNDSAAIIKQAKENPFKITSFKVKGLSLAAIDLLKSLLVIDPEYRISAKNAIKHPWIKLHRNNNDPGIDLVLNNLKEFNCQSKLKEAVHIFLATQIATYDDLKSFKASFQKLDKDGDGKITKYELIEEYCKTMNIAEAERLAIKIIDKLDQDKDGNIDYTEFLMTCTQRQRNVSLDELEIAFKMFDIDGNGSITADEIRGILENGQITEEETWKELLKEADTNGDGCIDLREFINLMNAFKTTDRFSESF